MALPSFQLSIRKEDYPYGEYLGYSHCKLDTKPVLITAMLVSREIRITSQHCEWTYKTTDYIHWVLQKRELFYAARVTFPSKYIPNCFPDAVCETILNAVQNDMVRTPEEIATAKKNTNTALLTGRTGLLIFH